MKETYYNPRKGFGGVNALRRVLPQKRHVSDIKKWLSSQDTYTLHKPIRHTFPRLKTIVTNIDQQFQADLADMRNISTHNDNFKYILTCIDVFTRYAWAIPLKNKSGNSIAEAFQEIFSERKPRFLQTDKGTEFKNSTVQELLKVQGIKFFTSQSPDVKASLVERFNRTLKEKMYRYFTYANTLNYLPVLDDLLYNYNHSYHRSIGMTPASVSQGNKEIVLHNLYGKQSPSKKYKFSIGESVRISKGRIVFKKGYLPGWSEEIFIISKRLSQAPPTYQLKDQEGEQLEGLFYEQELQAVKPKGKQDLFIIEEIIKTKGKGKDKQHLVKWRGYPTKFNQWISAAEIVQP